MSDAPVFRSRVLGAADGDPVERAGVLTSYVAEGILSDALRAGRGAQLYIDLARTVADGELAAIRRQFAWLTIRDIQVHIQRRLTHGRPRKAPT